MGKRKYENESQSEAKKSKNEDDTMTDFELSQNEKDTKKLATATSSKHIFDIKHFRKELAARQGQTMALTQFLQVCLNPDCELDFMLEYLKAGGNSHEILRQISQDNKKNLALATPTFHLFHLIILKVQTSLPHMITITEEACRYFLNTFVPTVEIMISENSGPRHRKIILKLLTSIVTLNSDLGIEVLNQIPLTPKNLQYITEKANYKEKDNVRTAFVHFITSFLVDGHLPLIKALLEKQGLLSLVIPGLINDEPEAVLMFLNILKRNVVDNVLISKTLKLKTFSQQVLHNLFKVFLWKGPPEMSNDVKKEYHNEIMNLLSDIVLTLYTSHKLGLYFIDSTLGVSDANKNQNLYKSILTFKRPWENKHQCDTLLEIVSKCPDLHRAIINIIEQSFQPQHSPIWEKTVLFFEKLLDKLRPEYLTPKLSKLNAMQTTNFIRFVTLPVPVLKIIQANIGKDLTISLYCVRVLVKMLQSLKRFMQILELEDENTKIDELKSRLENFLPKHLPQTNIIVSLVDEVTRASTTTENSQDYTLPRISDADALLTLTDLLLLVNYVYPAYCESVESLIDMRKILDYSMTLSEGQTSLLKFKIVSLWLMFDNSVLTLKNPVFKNLFLIMLTVYTSEDDNTWQEAKETMHMFLKNTEIFEADEDEIHLILYTLRIAKISNIFHVAEIFEHVLTNIEELSEYIRNQVVNFKISDENNKSDLDKLLNDLMNKKNSESSMFIENKIPSPFIVGCVQFLQNNKDAKKNLKQFLGLYVSNLLHWNYSPELIEVLIGDLKLDARSYVADWLVKPVPLSETTCNDNTLLKISNVIIEHKEISLENIFPVLTSFEDNAMEVETKAISSSDLFVWAKYLFFCVVRLTAMDKFEEHQQKNIMNYFENIINLGKKYHMIDVCRNIMLSFLKNAHILEIYRPLNLRKHNSSLIATKFILSVIKKNNDLVSYVNKSHIVLKPYQEKNYKEVIKAFIKIKKRKNVDSDHTVKVMQIIGTSKEGDAQIFEHIFANEILSCVKDDKEPSLVLDLLCVLLEKYSQLPLDLHQDTLQKSLKLYTNLLTNQELTPNLTKLELSLIQYFENKPHDIVHVSEDDFKKFFYANTIRKSTSQLASLLLQFNKKMCNIFKEEICRTEILSLRELTLPLANVIINYDEFIHEQKHLLPKIYEEYKSHIIKYLEKPHKIGQVYINSWKIIRKLIFETMSIEDCQKIFNKSYKFEIVETGHLLLLQTTFLKMCIVTEKYEKDYYVNYFISMLYLASNALRDNKNDETVSIVISNINTIINLYKMINDSDIENKQDFQKVTESGVWHSFCKIVLKDALKIRTTDQDNAIGPKKMSVLTALVKLIYSKDHSDIINLFDMVTSHSEFLNVMLSYHSPDIKFRLLEFLFTLLSINKSIIKAQQIPVYLSAYRATRSQCDRLILTILQFYESNNMPVNEYKPYVFGDSAANFYAVRKNRSSTLWGHPSPNQVLNLFDREIIEATIRNFPVDQKLDYNFVSFENLKVKDHVLKSRNKRKIKDVEAAVNNLFLKDEYTNVLNEIKEMDVTTLKHVEKDESIYDPAFLYPLLSHLLAPGSVASCFKLLRSGLLSVAVMGLSSHCHLMRAAAYHVLHRFCLLLETETRHKNDKLLLTDFINTLKQSLSTAINAPSNGELDLKNPRLPAIGALYLARAIMVSTYPSEPLYKPVNNFLIAKQFVDLTVVPDFLSLFHDSELETTERRIWILDIIKDGTKTMSDVNVVFKTMCLKMIMDFYTTVLCDRKSKMHILNALNSIVSVPRGFEILVEGYGFLSWMHFVVCESIKDNSILKAMIDLIRNMICSLNINVFVKHCAKISNKLEYLAEFKVKSDVEFEILNLVCEMLPNIDCLEDELIEYVKLLNLITKRSIKFLTKRQIVNIVAKCSLSVKHRESAILLNQAVTFNNATMLCSRIIVEESVNDTLCEELKTFVNTYIS